MNLTDTQKQQISKWIENGLKVAEIQSRLGSELGVRMTYMEVRFLIDDLKLALKDPPAPPQPTPDKTAQENAEPETTAGELPPEPMADELMDEPDATPPVGQGTVRVEVDRLARPGAVVSGNVTFSDGKSAQWYLDQFGRLGLIAKEEGYKPSQEDVMQFQRGLQEELAKMGF